MSVVSLEVSHQLCNDNPFTSFMGGFSDDNMGVALTDQNESSQGRELAADIWPACPKQITPSFTTEQHCDTMCLETLLGG